MAGTPAGDATRRTFVELVSSNYFAMVKAKFRDHVRSKTDVAMQNEVLCKFVCHNIVVVHSAIIELGIEGTFWPEKPWQP